MRWLLNTIVNMLIRKRLPERVFALKSKLGMSLFAAGALDHATVLVAHTCAQRPYAFQDVVAGFVDGRSRCMPRHSQRGPLRFGKTPREVPARSGEHTQRNRGRSAGSPRARLLIVS